MITHAILGTDLSKATDKIIESAGEFKSLGIGKISLTHVLNLRDTRVLGEFTIEGLEEKLDKQRNELISAGFEVESEMIYGNPSSELQRAVKARGAGLLIIGTHGRTMADSVLGSTASELLQNMKIPVLLMVMKKIETETELFDLSSLSQYEMVLKKMRDKEADWELYSQKLTPHILLPTDFSDFSEQAFQWIKNQKIKIPKLTLMHVQDEVRIKEHMEGKLGEFNKIDSARLNRLREFFQKAHPETEINIVLEYGKPIQLILDYINTKGVTLTVMGSQGRGFVAEIFMGSVSHQVARHADSNVLLIPLERS